MRISRDPAIGQPVEVVVGVHDRGQSGLVDGGTERRRIDVAHRRGPDRDLAVVQPSERAAVADEVLGAAVHALALHAPHVGDAHPADELGILAVGLLQPPPAGVSGDVEDRRQGEAGADRSDLPPDRRGHLLDQLGIPRGGQADRLGERVAPGPISPDSASSWASAGMPRRVRSSRNRWMRSLASAAGPGSNPVLAMRATWPIPSERSSLHPALVEPAFDEQCRVPDAAELRAPLLERHLPEQLLDIHQSSSCSASWRIASASSARSHPSATSSSSRRLNRST